jgi:hypothetical protein
MVNFDWKKKKKSIILIPDFFLMSMQQLSMPIIMKKNISAEIVYLN